MDLKINVRRGSRWPRRQLTVAFIGPCRQLAVLTVFFSTVPGDYSFS
jgi:hypothetical protein